MKNRKNRRKLGVQERMNSIKLVSFLLTPLIHPSLPHIQFSPLNPVVKISYSTNYPQLAYTAGIVTNYQLSTNIPTHRSTTHTHTPTTYFYQVNQVSTTLITRISFHSQNFLSRGLAEKQGNTVFKVYTLSIKIKALKFVHRDRI